MARRLTRTCHDPNVTFRRLDGILLLDKPTGLSSNAALQVRPPPVPCQRRAATPAAWTRWPPACCRCASARPPRSPACCWARAKAYDAEIVLGQTTDTDDADGQLLRWNARCRDRHRGRCEAAMARDWPHPASVRRSIQRAQAGRGAAV